MYIQWGMNPIYCLHELFSRLFERKWAIVSLILLFLCSTTCGIVFIKTPTFFEYHLRICDRFLNRVCYSDRSVVLICFERFFACVFFLLLIMLGGVHPATLVLTTTAIAFRAYTFGGSIAIFFSVYGASGALVVFALYFPIHILLDIIFLAAGAISFRRSFCFRFCVSDFKDLLIDFAVFLVFVLLICILEAFLLGVLFHPLGNLI